VPGFPEFKDASVATFTEVLLTAELPCVALINVEHDAKGDITNPKRQARVENYCRATEKMFLSLKEQDGVTNKEKQCRNRLGFTDNYWNRISIARDRNKQMWSDHHMWALNGNKRNNTN